MAQSSVRNAACGLRSLYLSTTANHAVATASDNGADFSRSLNLGISTTFGYTGLACGLVGSDDGDCAVMYDAGGTLRLKLFASSDVK